MRLICPNCQQAVSIPESDAGKTTSCPNCEHSFLAPQLYSLPAFEPSAPALPATPPAGAASTPTVATAPPGESHADSAPAAAPPFPEGYSKFRSCKLNRRVCEWLVPICMTLMFILTFFRWVGFYPGGNPAYTQNPWQMMIGSMSVNPVAEKVFLKEKELNE